MTVLETFTDKHKQIKEKLKSIVLPIDGSATQICWNIGTNLNVSGTTVKNYLCGEENQKIEVTFFIPNLST